MQSMEFCAYNKTRANVLSSKVTVINAVSDPLRVLKVLVEGLALHEDTALWLTPLKTLPTVPRISPYSLVFLDRDCQVVKAMELAPSAQVPRCDVQAESVLVLPIHTLNASQTTAGDSVVICLAEELQLQPTPILNPPPIPIAPPIPTSVSAAVKTSISIPPLPDFDQNVEPLTVDWPVTLADLHPQPSSLLQPIAPAERSTSAEKHGLLHFLLAVLQFRLRITVSIAIAPAAASARSPRTVLEVSKTRRPSLRKALSPARVRTPLEVLSALAARSTETLMRTAHSFRIGYQR
jgi:hypothetical protein